VIDVGGSKLKVLVSGETEPRKAVSGRRLTPTRLVESVRKLTSDWKYDAISIGIPGLVGVHGPSSEPGNLGAGWVGFDYAAAFGLPVRIVNDAVMQAVGSYDGGRMLFLGLGTGLGSALIAENVVMSLELGQIPFCEHTTLSEMAGRAGLKRIGKKEWRRVVLHLASSLMGAFVADYVVLGGGNSKQLGELPPGVRLGHNLTAFRGGFRLWHFEDLLTLNEGGSAPVVSRSWDGWRVI
jgi:hypothetical protein